jgi:hypothetical protein
MNKPMLTLAAAAISFATLAASSAANAGPVPVIPGKIGVGNVGAGPVVPHYPGPIGVGNIGGGPHFGGGVSIGFVGSGAIYDDGGDCYYVRRAVVVPGVGVVRKRQLVCE